MGSQPRCPYCANFIDAPVLRVERPFSCPHCGRIVHPRSAHARYSGIGCFSVALLLLGVGIYLGARVKVRGGEGWWWVAGGVFASISGGVAAGLIIHRTLRLLLGDSTRLRVHELREYPDTVRELADFLDEIKDGTTWLDQWNHKLTLLETSHSGDEALVAEGLIAANRLKWKLTGAPATTKKYESRDLDKLSLDGLRRELGEIARDLRKAANGGG